MSSFIPGSGPVGAQPRGPLAASAVASRIMAIESGNEQIGTAINLGERQGDKVVPQIPQNVIGRDARDTDQNIKAHLSLPPDKGGIGATPTMPVTQQDISYLKSKQAKQEEVSFYDWLNKAFDRRDLGQWNAVDKAFPENTQRQMDYVNRVAQLQKQIVRLKVLPMNAWGRDDYYFLYLIKSGRIHVPEAPLHKLDSIGAGENDRAERYRRGLFSFKKTAPKKIHVPSNIRDFQDQGSITTDGAYSYNGTARGSAGKFLPLTGQDFGRTKGFSFNPSAEATVDLSAFGV